MIKKSNSDVIKTYEKFRKFELPVTFIVPTDTGLKKSIMDATYPVRSFLLERGLHNFSEQETGENSRVYLESLILANDQVISTKTSLYRPNTKEGDPRIWVYKLAQYSDPFDLWAILNFEKILVFINCSKTNLDHLFKKPNSVVTSLLNFNLHNESSVAQELLTKCKNISRMGFVKTMKAGDTGIGFTFESLLGITANSSKSPDYKGIEIKTSRSKKNKGTLLSMVPNWALSKIKSSEELVDKRGKLGSHGPLKTIFNTLSATKVNSHDLALLLSENEIFQTFHSGGVTVKDVLWVLQDLIDRLSAKHKETFWIEAERRGVTGSSTEEFHFNRVTHTSNIDKIAIPNLIHHGVITMDYLLWEKAENWKQYVHKNGFDFLWKIRPKDRPLLFKFIRQYDLREL